MNNFIENSFSHLSDDVCDELAEAARQKSEEMGIPENDELLILNLQIEILNSDKSVWISLVNILQR